MLLNIANSIGKRTIRLAQSIGKFSIFSLAAITSIIRPPLYFSLIIKQLLFIGFYSLPVVAMTTFSQVQYWHYRVIQDFLAFLPKVLSQL